MVDEFKSLKDSLLKSVWSAVSRAGERGPEGPSSGTMIRDLISSLASIAGKGKDEIVQIISREIGQAVAGVIKEPVLRILEDQRLNISIELVPKKDEKTSESHSGKKTKKAPRPKRGAKR